MNVYNCAHQLAKALKESDEYIVYKNLEIKVKANPEVKVMMDDFRRRQFEVQGAQMMGQAVEESKLLKLQELHSILMKDGTISEFMQAEYRLTQMMADIYKILGEAVELDFDLNRED